MSRIKLIEQESYEFSYSLQVRPQDINYSGHVGNDNLISLVGAARAYTFHLLGHSEMNVGDRKTGVIMTDLVVNYKAEAYLFDSLTIDSRFGEFTRSGFRMFHRVRREDTTVGLIETGFVCYDYNLRKVVPVPDIFITSLPKYS
jgi:acyl-CoA thioester hydrolase